MSRIVVDLYSRILTMIKAWTLLRPDKIFARMSLEDFQKVVAGSRDARMRVAEAEAHLKQELAARDDADKLSRKAVQRVVNAVKADLDEGEDGELYTAMGYVAKSVRNSLRGIRRAKSAEKAKEGAA